MRKVLLMWIKVPASVDAYVLTGADADLATQSAGLYINAAQTEGHSIETLAERLADLTPLDTFSVLEGPFDQVVVCGIRL